MSKQNNLASKTKIRWLFTMARRDLKANARKLSLFMASIIIGIAAVVAIQSFGNNLTDSIALQSKALMGADYLIDSGQPPNEKVLRIIDSLGGAKGKEISFASMVTFPKKEATKLVQVVGVEGGFPFYGDLITTPSGAASGYQSDGGALVDATVMLQYNLVPGDSIKVGFLTFPISGVLKSAPGRSALTSSVAPAVYIPYRFLEKTGLLQKGSRVTYKYYFIAAPDQDLEELNSKVDPLLDAEGADMDTHTDTSRRLGRRYENFGKFLNMVAFIALLLGCIGIASAVHVYIKGKLKAIAVLKCMGATRKQTFLIYLLQIAVLGFIGGVVGTLAGVALQQSAPYLLQEYLPLDVDVSLSIPSIILGISLGIFMSVTFALLPLLRTWYVSPLQVLRVQDTDESKSGVARSVVLGIIFLFIFLFALRLLDNWKYALSFVAGILVTFSMLAGVAALLMKAVKRFFPTSWGFCSRQSLLNLFRPQNQTTTLLLAIGVGAFLISTLYFTKDILLNKVSIEGNDSSPNIILLDVQTEQVAAVTETILPNNVPLLDDIPIITMRVHSIKGTSVNAIRNDTTSNVGRWVLNHEFRVTYRDSLIASETIKEGAWTGNYNTRDLVPISIAENFAFDAKVTIGDKVTFNVQGVLIETIIGSIRAVDWGRLQLNFSVLFPKGVLDDAPKFHVLTTNTPDDATSAALQRQLVSKFPNISIIDLRQILALLEGILDKIGLVINFMAFLSILTGVVVLIGAVSTSKYQRIKESVLLRTIGATSKQLLKISFLEYAFLGFLGSLTGISLSLISSFLLATFVFEDAFVPASEPFTILLPGFTVLVILIGLFNSRTVLNTPPLEVLRKEGK